MSFWVFWCQVVNDEGLCIGKARCRLLFQDDGWWQVTSCNRYEEERCTQTKIFAVRFIYMSAYLLYSKSKQPFGMEGASRTDAFPWIDFNNLRVAIIL